MEHLYFFFLFFPLVGIITGFLSGMLGIGGSIIVIPALYVIFEYIGIPRSELMHFSIGTAFSIMIFTSITNAASHIRMGNSMPSIIKKMIPSLVIGVIISSWSIKYIESESLKRIFAVFLLLVSLDLLIKFTRFIRKCENQNLLLLSSSGLVIGILSGLLGIGGGSMVIPFLLYLGFEIRKVIGTSAVLTFPIALCGAGVSMLHMIHIQTDVPMSAGFIYLPALIIVSIFSIISVPFGAKMLNIIPQEKARLIFAALLLLTSLKLFF